MAVTYTAGSASSEVNFMPGVTVGAFTVAVVNDSSDGPNKVLPLALTTPVYATTGGLVTATLTVEDDDPPPSVQFASGAYTVTENAGVAVITVTLSVASEYTVTASYVASLTTNEMVLKAQPTGTQLSLFPSQTTA